MSTPKQYTVSKPGDTPPRMTDAEYDAEQKAIFAEYDIPKELQGALSYMAYERGHYAGMEEQAIVLRNLASDLAKPLQDLIARVKTDTLLDVSGPD